MVELIIAVAIIAAIVAIAVPVTLNMRESTRRAGCLTNLRTLGLATEGYMTDHGGGMPRFKMGRSNTYGDNVIETELADYVNGSTEVFKCPADHEHHADSGCSYFWNHHIGGFTYSQLDMFGVADEPGQIPLIYDKEAFHGDEDGTQFLYADLSAGKELRFGVGEK